MSTLEPPKRCGNDAHLEVDVDSWFASRVDRVVRTVRYSIGRGRWKDARNKVQGGCENAFRRSTDRLDLARTLPD